MPRKRRSILEIGLLMGLSLLMYAQEKPVGVDFNLGEMNNLTNEKLLQMHHIGLTKDALVQALSNHDSAVRVLAASQLQMVGATDTLTEIVAAMEREGDIYTRVSLADTVAKFGDARGIQALKSICADSTVPGVARLEAAQNLVVNFRNESCRPMAEVLRSKDDPSTRAMALQIIPLFHQMSDVQSKEIVPLILTSLSDPEILVRSAAGETIGRLELVSAIPNLKIAIANENLPDLRSSLQKSLQRLLDKEKQN
jgi:HEAT repeat protein